MPKSRVGGTAPLNETPPTSRPLREDPERRAEGGAAEPSSSGALELEPMPTLLRPQRDAFEGVVVAAVVLMAAALCNLERVGRIRLSLAPTTPTTPATPAPPPPPPPEEAMPTTALPAGSEATFGCRRNTTPPRPLAAWRRAKTASLCCARSARASLSFASARCATASKAALARAAGVGDGA